MFGYNIIIRQASTYIPKCRLSNKIAIVTGASTGIGYAIARRLGQEGAKLSICSRNKKNICDALKKLTNEGIDAIATVCHVGLAKDRKQLVDDTICKFGALDILVSNAGTETPKLGNLMQCDAKMWDTSFDTNVKASFFLAKECIPHLAKRGQGSIIFLSAIAGYHPFTNMGLYSVTKTAILGVTKALAKDIGSNNIRVNSIAPGIIKTAFSKYIWNDKEVCEKYMNKILMKRFGEPKEVAGVAAFLASDDSHYISGETIVVAGGMKSRF